jgi:hypothetical protein
MNSINNFLPVSSVAGTPTDPAVIHLIVAIGLMWAITLAVPANIGIYLPWLAILGFLAIPENSSGIFGTINKLIGNVPSLVSNSVSSTAYSLA